MTPRARTLAAIADMTPNILIMAIAQGLIPHGWWAFAAGVLGMLGTAGLLWPRRPWSDAKKIAESKRRIAAGLPPLNGYEYLLLPEMRSPEDNAPIEVPRSPSGRTQT